MQLSSISNSDWKNHSLCEWKIISTPKSKIKLEFTGRPGNHEDVYVVVRKEDGYKTYSAKQLRS